MSCLRRILGIRWQDKVPDTVVLEREQMPSVHTLLEKVKVRWSGQVVRMSNDRLPEQLLYGEMCRDKRKVGGQKKRYKDTLKISLRSLHIDIDFREPLAQDRWSRHSKITYGAIAAEVERIENAQSKRAARNNLTASTDVPIPTQKCSTCGRSFRARKGLISHLRTRQNDQTTHS